MPKFLFWNLNQRHIPELIAQLARAELADVLILAECAIEPALMLQALNAERTEYDFGFTSCHRLRVFTRFQASLMPAVLETDRVTIRQLKLPGRNPLLVVGVHLPSKINLSDESQVFESVYLARVIEEVEKQEKNQRTLVMGDLNMNPFEAGVVGARGGLHAVPSRRVAQRFVRTVQREDCRFFYNPMWSHLGPRTLRLRSGQAPVLGTVTKKDSSRLQPATPSCVLPTEHSTRHNQPQWPVISFSTVTISTCCAGCPSHSWRWNEWDLNVVGGRREVAPLIPHIRNPRMCGAPSTPTLSQKRERMGHPARHLKLTQFSKLETWNSKGGRVL